MKGGEKGRGHHSTFEKGATCLRGIIVCVGGGGVTLSDVFCLSVIFILRYRRITLYWAESGKVVQVLMNLPEITFLILLKVFGCFFQFKKITHHHFLQQLQKNI
jgi:hypothetical protein